MRGEDSESATRDVDDSPTPLEALRKEKMRAKLLSRPMRPLHVGRYTVRDLLGRGGMSYILEAYDPELERNVALKILLPNIEKLAAERLLREARALAKLSHPNVVQVYEVGREAHNAYVAMERLSGRDLGRWMLETRPDWKACVRAYVRAGRGLAAAHTMGLVHRDFKPSNCMIDAQQRVKVLDFGLVRDVSSALQSTDVDAGVPDDARTAHEDPITRGVLGTPGYMPPEQMIDGTADARSDQFSFCVALFEAVHGERPFEGDSVSALRTAIEHRRVRPTGGRMPGALRAALLRGLEPDPAARWPSMDALLARLETLERSRRWWWLGGIGLVGGLAATWALLPEPTPSEPSCDDGAERAALVWSDERRDAVEGSFRAFEAESAVQTLARANETLDDYAQQWAAAHDEACRVHHLTGRQSASTFDARMRCLDARQAEWQQTIDLLGSADERVAARADEMLAALVPPSQCSDSSRLERSMAPPDDPQLAAQVAELRHRLAQAQVSAQAGKYEQFAAATLEISKQARQLDYLPLQIELHNTLGRADAIRHNQVEAQDHFETAYKLALEIGYDAQALEAALQLARSVRDRALRPTTAARWLETAEALASRSGDASSEIELLEARALVDIARGELADAERAQRRALAAKERLLGDGHWGTANTMANLAGIVEARGRRGEAERLFERSIAVTESRFGPAHPIAADIHQRLGSMSCDASDYPRAQQAYQRALEIRRAWFPPDAPDVLWVLVNLADCHGREGRLKLAEEETQRTWTLFQQSGVDEPWLESVLRARLGMRAAEADRLEDAAEHFGRALSLQERLLSPDSTDLANTLNDSAHVWRRQGDYVAAREAYERALAIHRRIEGSESSDVALVLSNLGNVALFTGALGEAERRYLEAIAIDEKLLGPHNPEVGRVLSNLSNVYMDQQRYEDATATLRRAIEIQSVALPGESPTLNVSYINLATSLRNQGKLEEAIGFLDTAEAGLALALPRDHVYFGYVHAEYAKIDLARGQLEQALAHGQQAITRLESSDPAELAMTRYVLLRVVEQRDRRADALLRKQLRASVEASSRDENTRKAFRQFDQWLARESQ
ncbi:MAG: serine/threonine-protein kinase [Myxococcota bacterium]